VQTFRRSAVHNELDELRFKIHVKQALYQTNTNTFKTSWSASVQNLIVNVRKNTFRRFGDQKCGKKGLTFLRPLDVFCANKLKYLQIGLILWLKGKFLSEKCRRKCVDLGSKKKTIATFMTTVDKTCHKRVSYEMKCTLYLEYTCFWTYRTRQAV
jgi:hypothetical protein